MSDSVLGANKWVWGSEFGMAFSKNFLLTFYC